MANAHGGLVVPPFILLNPALGGKGLTPPFGFIFLVDSDGAYLVDSDGAYLIEAI